MDHYQNLDYGNQNTVIHYSSLHLCLFLSSNSCINKLPMDSVYPMSQLLIPHQWSHQHDGHDIVSNENSSRI